MKVEVAMCSLGFEVGRSRTKPESRLLGGCGEVSAKARECLLCGDGCSWCYRWSLGSDDSGESAAESSRSGAGEIGDHCGMLLTLVFA